MLSVEHLSTRYPCGFALRDISFRAPTQAITGIIGPNGSGKSTLLHAICKELPSRGTVEVNGKKLWKMNLSERARTLAFVPQIIEKLPISIMDFVLTGRTPYRKWFQLSYSSQDRRIAEENLKKTGLADLFSAADPYGKTLEKLSGGERQLAAIARALCQEPTLLLLDEPTANLDISHQIKVLRTIRDITVRSQTTTLLVIHDINLAIAFCDRIVCLRHGEILAEGRVPEILNRDMLEKIYETSLCIGTHPQTGSPLVLPAY